MHEDRIEPIDRERNVLAVNAGSSSVKFQLVAMPSERLLFGGRIEGIGGLHARLHYSRPGSAQVDRTVSAPDHDVAIALIFALLDDAGSSGTLHATDVVGHRVVHGGPEFDGPVRFDEAIMAALEKLDTLAPLHNAPNLTGVRAARELLPDVPQFAVFDTAFHRSLPEHAQYYALPLALQREWRIRRYGFHGLSHGYVAAEVAQWLGRPLAELKVISLHLGSGASACAIRGGYSIDTSMGFTPLEGLVMGTRCGDLDPALPAYLAATLGLDNAQLKRLLQEQSGLLGLGGDADMRRIEQRREAGDEAARLAFDVFCYRVRKYVGAYYAVLDGLDALVFTAGIGEHSASVRDAVCTGMEALGIGVDRARNAAAGPAVVEIGRRDLPVRVLIVPTNEELEIARATYAALSDAASIHTRAGSHGAWRQRRTT
jgi:acetate kinase